MKFLVTTIGGPEAGLRCLLTEHGVLVVGRGEDCDLRLADPSVSRVHARIALVNGRVYLEDAGSRWGTRVNGVATESRELSPGDCVEVGDTQLRLEADSPLATTLAPIQNRKVPIHQRILKKFARGARRDAVADNPGQNPRHARPLPRARAKPADNGSPSPKAPDISTLVGKKFLCYRVDSIVAQRTGGIVFRAIDLRHDERPVALKVFRSTYFPDRRSAARFLRAMRSTISLQHENLVRLCAAGRTRGLCFTASEFVEGETVAQMIQRIGVAGMLDWQNARHVAAGVAAALEFAHEQGILHRNLGPGNIFVRSEDRCVKLGDLMFAKALGQSECDRITRPGEVVGNLHYLSPEQLSGEQPVDARADIYSLGAALYAILTGRPPFEGGSAAEVMRRIVSGVPESPTRFHLAIPSHFEGLVLRMLAKRPEDRPESASALRRELQRIGRYCDP